MSVNHNLLGINYAFTVLYILAASSARVDRSGGERRVCVVRLDIEPDLADCEVMSFVDLIKATVICAGVAFLIYSFPALAQGLIISGLTLLWLSYARKTVAGWLRR